MSFSSILDTVRAGFLESLPHWICPYEMIYHDLVQIGAGQDAPSVSFRDARSLAVSAQSASTAGTILADLDGLRSPPGRHGRGSAYSNFDVTFARTHEGLSVRIAFLPKIHDAAKVRSLATLIRARCVNGSGLVEGPSVPAGPVSRGSRASPRDQERNLE
jgi:hypothetical protein